MNNILVTRSSMPDFEEYVNEIKDIWQSHWLTNMGVKHQQLQKDLIDYIGVEKLDLFVEPAGRSYHHAVYLCFNNTCYYSQWTEACVLRY